MRMCRPAIALAVVATSYGRHVRLFLNTESKQDNAMSDTFEQNEPRSGPTAERVTGPEIATWAQMTISLVWSANMSRADEPGDDQKYVAAIRLATNETMSEIRETVGKEAATPEEVHERFTCAVLDWVAANWRHAPRQPTGR